MHHPILKNAGNNVIALQLSLHSLRNYIATVKRAINQMGRPVTLVGHSWGGHEITDAAYNNPNVTGLVYIAADPLLLIYFQLQIMIELGVVRWMSLPLLAIFACRNSLSLTESGNRREKWNLKITSIDYVLTDFKIKNVKYRVYFRDNHLMTKLPRPQCHKLIAYLWEFRQI
jgi:pimeloyl-ACP methyl ester carboxylesterase